MRLFVGVVAAADGSAQIQVVDDDRTEVASAGVPGVEAGSVAERMRALDGEPVVTAVADAALAAALAADLGWTATATTRGSAEWPVCLTVDDGGRGPAFCADLAWRWHHRPEGLSVQGDRLGEHRVVALDDLAAELVLSVDPARLEDVRAAVEALPGVREVR